MNDFNDLEAYNGDTEHEMWVDFTYQENTNEFPDLLDEDVVDEYINNLNDWD